MTNRLAIWLALIVIGLLALDHYVLRSGATLFLGRELFDLVKWMAFWR